MSKYYFVKSHMTFIGGGKRDKIMSYRLEIELYCYNNLLVSINLHLANLAVEEFSSLIKRVRGGLIE